MKLEHRQIFEKFIKTYGGLILVWAGPEGCGKSSRIRDLQTALAGVVDTPAIFFSTAISNFCRKKVDTLKGPKNVLKRGPYEEVLKKMESRRKDIDSTILTLAFRDALQFMPRSGTRTFGKFGILCADGCLRLPEQVGMALNVFGDLILSTNPTVIIELQTPPAVAFERAMTRGGSTDTRENIERAHAEFGGNMQKVLVASKPYADHVKVDVSADDPEVNNDAVAATLCDHLVRIMEEGQAVKTLIPPEEASVAA